MRSFRGHETLQLLDPVLDDGNVLRGRRLGWGIDVLEHQESPLERHVVSTRTERRNESREGGEIGRTVEELPWWAGDPLCARRDRYRHHAAVVRPVEQLAAVARPQGLGSTTNRDGPLPAIDIGKRTDVNLEGPASVGLIRKPSAVRRDLGVDLLV